VPARLPIVLQGLPVVCYEIEVETGGQAGAGTTARVYLELCGGSGSSGDHRLMYRDEGGTVPSGPRTAFREGATDRFKLHCQPLGPLVKVGYRLRCLELRRLPQPQVAAAAGVVLDELVPERPHLSWSPN
jgi:hypothetical protein